MNIDSLSNFKIEKTYLYYDGPLLFSTIIDNKTFLAYSWGANRNEFMFFETSSDDLKLLEENKIGLRSFFRKSKSTFRVTFSEVIPVIEQISSETIEEEAYIKEDVFLDWDKEE